MLFLIVKWYNRKTNTRQKWLKFYFLHATKLSVGLLCSLRAEQPFFSWLVACLLLLFVGLWSTSVAACSLWIISMNPEVGVCFSHCPLQAVVPSLQHASRCWCFPTWHTTSRMDNVSYVNSILMRYSYLSKIQAASTCWMMQLCKYDIAGMQQLGTLCSSWVMYKPCQGPWVTSEK